MKSKTLIGLASLLLCVGMASACGEQPAPTTSTEPTTTQPSVEKFTVRFLVDGNPIKTIEVEKGQKAVYDGETPTKAADADAFRYGFRGWDKDLETPITANTDFNAKFAAYAEKQVVDDFESYSSAGAMSEAGWASKKYTESGWVAASAKIVPGYATTGGTKSLRYEAYRNEVAFKAEKTFEIGQFEKSANAFQFSLKAPKEMYEVSASFSIRVPDVAEPIPLKYRLANATDEKKLSSEEYIVYTIPFNNPNWHIYDGTSAHKMDTLNNIAHFYGMEADDALPYVSGVAFTVKGTSTSNSDAYVYIDDISFVTVDDDVEVEEAEKILDDYKIYTAEIQGGLKVRLEIGENGAATATVSNDPSHPIAGTIAVDGKMVTFTSADQGATLVYKGQLTNGNQKIKYVEATGALATYINSADMNAVQVVEDFESYTESGKAYYQSGAKENRSGLRGAYYMEYRDGSSNTSPWHSANSLLMGGSGDQMNLITDATTAHGGSKYASMKISNSSIMRYMTWGLFDGTAEATNAFRGKWLAFWVKSEVKISTIRVRFYYITNPDGTAMGSNCNKGGQTDIVVNATVGEWTRKYIELDTNKIYFGFNFQLHENGATAGNMFVDDICCYTTSPYF